jgi:hypothetical protein
MLHRRQMWITTNTIIIYTLTLLLSLIVISLDHQQTIDQKLLIQLQIDRSIVRQIIDPNQFISFTIDFSTVRHHFGHINWTYVTVKTYL